MATTKAAGMSGRVVLKHSPFNQTTIIRPYCVTWSEILYGRRWSSEAKTGSGPNGLLCGGPILKPAHWTRPVNGVETEAELKSLRHSLARGTPFCLRHSFLFATLIGERRLQQSSASNPRFDLEADQNDRISRMSPFHSHFSPTHQGKERQMLLSNGESRQCATLSPDIRNSAPLNDTYWPGLPLPCPPRYQLNFALGPKSSALNGVGCRPRVVNVPKLFHSS